MVIDPPTLKPYTGYIKYKDGLLIIMNRKFSQFLKMVGQLGICLMLASCSMSPDSDYENVFRFQLTQMVADNDRHEVYFKFHDSVKYDKRLRTQIGHLMVSNKANMDLHLFNYDILCGLIKTQSDEAIASIHILGKPYEILDWSNPFLDAFEYRLNFPPKTRTTLPLDLDIRYAARELLDSVTGQEVKVNVEIYPCNLHTGTHESRQGRSTREKPSGISRSIHLRKTCLMTSPHHVAAWDNFYLTGTPNKKGNRRNSSRCLSLKASVW